ncbi:MAG: alginate lyase family protein [Blastocatellia bacterium]
MLYQNIAKLNKLRGMRLSELTGRSQQEFVKLADRLFIASAGEMSDEALYREFLPIARNSSGEGTVELLRDRLRAGTGLFLPPLADRRGIVEMMNRRFPVERDAIIASAEKSARGRLELLGHADLDFGHPIDWHLDPTSGQRAPFVHWSRIDSVKPIGTGDLKVFWEVQRTAHFVTFGQAYWLSGDHRYAEEFVSQASSWIASNPPGMGVGWAASLDVAFRAIAWLWALHLCADSREMTPGILARMVKSLIEHGRHIEKYLSTYFSPNTHLTGEALGLFYLGVALPELRRAAKWRQLGLRILIEELPKHVRGDGVYFEQSSYYHRYTTDFYTHLFAIIRGNGVALPREDEQMLWQKLEALYNHLMWIGRPDGAWPLFGDDDGGRLIRFAPRASNDFRDTLALGAAIFKRGDLKRMAGEAPVEMLWLMGPEGVACYDRLEAKAPREISQAFKTSGFFVMRDGWEPDSSFALIDCGLHGPGGPGMGQGHSHSDALAIELAIRGTTWLVDPATFVYGADPATRDWFRGTGAHNTAMVDGEDQSLASAPFAWRTSANCSLIAFDDLGDCAVFEGSHDGYQRLNDPVTHTRSVVMLRKQSAFIVSDHFMARTRHTYTIRHHFAPGCTAAAFDRRIEAQMPNGDRLVINTFVKGVGLSRLDTRIENGWVSTCYGRRTEAPVAVFEASGDGPLEFTTVIAPAFDSDLLMKDASKSVPASGPQW